MTVHTRFKSTARLVKGTVEDLYVELSDGTPMPVTDLASVNSVTFKVFTSVGVDTTFAGTCTVDGMTAISLIDTSTLDPGTYSLYNVVAIGATEAVQAGPFAFTVVAP